MQPELELAAGVGPGAQWSTAFQMLDQADLPLVVGTFPVEAASVAVSQTDTDPVESAIRVVEFNVNL